MSKNLGEKKNAKRTFSLATTTAKFTKEKKGVLRVTKA
jgi:hypothetical protein